MSAVDVTLGGMDRHCVLDAEYLEMIALVEAFPENQSGSDKSWVSHMHAAFDEYCKHTVRPVDPFASIARTLGDHHRQALQELLDRQQRESS